MHPNTPQAFDEADIEEALPELGAAVGAAREEGGGGHAAGITWLSGRQFKWAAVA